MKKIFSSRSPDKMVRRNTLWNIFGQGFPLLLAVFFIPPLIKGVGTDRFGALTLVWTFLTYFSLFDLGVGRALTQLLAEISHEEKKDEADLVWMASTITAGLGIFGALILFLLAPFVASKLLRLHGSLETEMILSLKELALVLPILLHSLALKGILEAKRRFDISNLIRIPLGVFTYGVPLLILPFSHSLSTIVAALLLGRTLAWLYTLWKVFEILPHLKSMPVWRPKKLKNLLYFGGWVTLSSILIPVIGSLDKIFISRILSISMVAYYTTPFELVTKLWIISAAIGGTIFPEFASRFFRGGNEAEVLYMRGFKYILAILFPLVLLTTAYAHEGLAIWLNPEFATRAAPVLQWLALSTLIGGVAQVPYFFLLGVNRPRVPAFILLFELPIYFLGLYLLIKVDGVRGAAIGYTLRAVFEFVFLFWFSGRVLKFRVPAYQKTILPLGLAVLSLLFFQANLPLLLKSFLVLMILTGQAWLVWAFVLETKDKNLVRRLLHV